jgi:hypothetical protein
MKDPGVKPQKGEKAVLNPSILALSPRRKGMMCQLPLRSRKVIKGGKGEGRAHKPLNIRPIPENQRSPPEGTCFAKEVG